MPTKVETELPLEGQYPIKDRFPDPASYIKFMHHNCKLCTKQSDGSRYDCELLRQLDRAFIQTGYIPESFAEAAGINLKDKYKHSDRCTKYISRRAKVKPDEEKAP